MPLSSFLRAWVAGLVAFLVGEYGAGAVLRSVRASSGDAAMLDLVWLPWVAAPVLCGAAAALALAHPRRAAWWHWVVAAVVVPVGAAVVTAVVVALVGASPTGLVTSVLVQVVLAALVGLGVGTLRARWTKERPQAARPVSYVSQEGGQA